MKDHKDIKGLQSQNLRDHMSENFWLTQKALADLFGVQHPAITKHLKNIIETGELVESSVSSILEHTADDGFFSAVLPCALCDEIVYAKTLTSIRDKGRN